MCGINGILTRKTELPVEKVLSRMNERIIHRGPDQDGFFIEKVDQYQIGMAMRRLSIIDLNTGKQPIYSDDGRICIVFNGEIYNFKGLKSQLEAEGIKFKTTSDTEVILKLYEKYGTKAFSLLDGMFGFSIYDKNLEKLFIARDFFGEKPLYFYRDSESFYWASELKSIISNLDFKPKISRKGLNLYFRLTYIPAPYTIYEGVQKLEPNNYIELDCVSNNYSIQKIETQLKAFNKIESFKEAKKITHDLVNQSVESRSIADVPLGTFLSGGVDSSIVSLALAQQKENKIDTFSVGFDKKSFDETDKSRTVAKLINSNHHEFIISIGDLKDNIDNILLNFDEPFADSSSLPTYLVANKTRDFVKVALTGDGGDEIFGGYNKYYMGKMNSRYTSLIPESGHNFTTGLLKKVLSTKDDKRGMRFKIKKALTSINYDGDYYFNIISLAFQNKELNTIIKPNYQFNDIWDYYRPYFNSQIKSLHDFRLADKHISLEGDMLVKVDRTSMLTSLESRAPFLNKDLWSFSNSLPEEYLMKGWNKKYILKEAFKHYFPEKFLDKSKKGFGVPVGDWLRDYLSSELKSYCDANFLSQQNIFNINEIRELVYKHLSGKEDNTFRVWAFFCFQKWYKNTYLSSF
ncbi:asparagine synthase (glutamine-hydrolyzing) [Christiangramia salexigens]|uniref:asparagine synthase (glutamine-hydrolyzing) n=1 Tax=Christiangramia salexigens TaxID=1913577 RepID=A0A1L3J2E1_9FLAO|nr:asparagine synthase (glutamine-hydrolyzing) [Christiangramia salexigens]APG59280.1 asparagine synthase (glutamine-hydrolyzing) [Christiangramia salexigens]